MVPGRFPTIVCMTTPMTPCGIRIPHCPLGHGHGLLYVMLAGPFSRPSTTRSLPAIHQLRLFPPIGAEMISTQRPRASGRVPTAGQALITANRLMPVASCSIVMLAREPVPRPASGSSLRSGPQQNQGLLQNGTGEVTVDRQDAVRHNVPGG